MLPDGAEFSGKSFPVLLKRYQAKTQGHIVIYVDDMFGIFTLFEVLALYSEISQDIKKIVGEKIKDLT